MAIFVRQSALTHKPRHFNDFSPVPFCTSLAWRLIQTTSVRGVAIGTFALAMAVSWTAGDPVAGQSPRSDAGKATFRSGVDLVRITAVVQDRRGRPVLGLLPADFELNVSGEPVQIVEFGSEATGVSIALLIDDSGSMSLAGRREAAQDVATRS